MQSIEKNDIDLSKLFSWGTKITLLGRNNEELIDVYIRLVGDENLNRARVYGLRKSAELRKQLRNENSDERMAYIPDRDIAKKENAIEQVLIFKIKDYTSQAFNELKFNIPSEPGSKASLEDMENYQKEIDNFPKTREDQIKAYVNDLITLERERLLKLDIDRILNEYEDLVIDQFCESEMISKYREMCVFYGTFTDEKYKNRLFSTIDEMLSYPTEIKNQLLDAYVSLEFGGEELKN